MKIILMHQTVTKHDAIGNDIEVMFHILNENNDCKVYSQNGFNNKLLYIEKEELYDILNDLQSLIIYHHSVYWEEGEEILRRHKGRIIIRYHNITPPIFFQKYNLFHYEQCDKGRKQTRRLAREFENAIWLVDSNYNAEDIMDVEKKRIDICPPFNKIEKWAKGKPEEGVLKGLLQDDKVNLLFVGRIAPNKGHLFLLDIVHNYCINFDTNIKLRIIGKFDDGLKEYNREITSKITAYGLEDNIEFIGEINDSLLISYYLGSDFFLCVSEHEGFCVPVPEAQFFQLPVIARNISALPETLGEDQIILDDNIMKYSAAINILYKNEKYKNFIRENGLRNYNKRFTYTRILERFKNILENRMGVKL